MTGNGSFKQHLVLCVINTLEWLHSCTVNNQSRLEKGKKEEEKKQLNAFLKLSPDKLKTTVIDTTLVLHHQMHIIKRLQITVHMLHSKFDILELTSST